MFVGFWSLIGGIVGIVFWEFLHYWRRLLKQPFLTPNNVPADLKNHQTTAAKASGYSCLT